MNDANGSRRVSDLVVATLAKEIANAKAGSIEAVALIIVGPDGRPRVEFGGEGDLMPSINLGVDMFKAQLMARVLGASGAVTEHSGLVLPGMH